MEAAETTFPLSDGRMGHAVYFDYAITRPYGKLRVELPLIRSRDDSHSDGSYTCRATPNTFSRPVQRAMTLYGEGMTQRPMTNGENDPMTQEVRRSLTHPP